MSIKVYIVAGGHSVGKSSVICQICGIKPEKEDMDPMVIPLHTKKYGTLNFFCDSKSLQESNIPPDGIEAHIKSVNGGENCEAILISLRTDKIPKISKQPEADRYIDKFKSLGWEIEGVIELVGYLREHSEQNKYRYQSFKPIPSINQLCKYVKKFFGITKCCFLTTALRALLNFISLRRFGKGKNTSGEQTEKGL